ncbi:ABC transporter permease [Pseudoclavibacter helvolus]|uniref:Putative spermidine/putrescine transport system permease protein n=1 Tax=Pseudoclavibacter helvolus TaxID=255205 RepID=A0A7W4UPW7_9MICO|nr:ABC transporter permease subunit [Pseudoclavibacter helvolus]MBB2958376.1 putative spermidine/putrescine transport system permease protein [Pseudoclavibacter helvolus]
MTATAPLAAATEPVGAAAPAVASSALGRRPWGAPRAASRTSLIGVAPFLVYTGVFLLLPTLLVVVGAFFTRQGVFTTSGFERLFSPASITIFWTSTWLSVVTAVLGAIIGAVVAYALSTSPANSIGRRVFTAFNSVLAQFGGVMLAFAFVATIGTNGMLTRFLQGAAGFQVDSGFLSSVPGLVAVYLYFQVPLMVSVFLPAVDGIRKEWRDATVMLGGSSFVYWFRVAGPLLAPSFLGSVLLLFANSFSAFATAAALISQQTIIVPMEIEAALRNENTAGLESYAQALALGMIVVVAIVMSLYALLQKRSSRWLSR